MPMFGFWMKMLKRGTLSVGYAVATVLKEDLRLLGLHAPEEM